MELGLAPRRKKSRLGYRAWFFPPFGGTVYAGPSPTQPALYLGGPAELVGSLEEHHETTRPRPSLCALAARGCRSGEAADGHGVDRHCSSRQLELNQRAATAVAYRQTLRLGTDRRRTSSPLALSDLRRPRRDTGTAS